MYIENEILQHIISSIHNSLNNKSEYDIDDYLEYRDNSDFDRNWVNSDKHITSLKVESADFENREKSLREQTFKAVLHETDNYDLAGYISDDAGLIYANLFFQYNDLFANKIYASYQSNQLPK